MELVARVIGDLPLVEGTSKAGNPFRKKQWITETFGQYPKRIVLGAMNAALDSLNIEVGKIYNFSIDIESREYNGRWYTDVRVFRAVETVDPTISNTNTGGTTGPANTVAPQPAAPANNPFEAPAPANNPFAAGAPGASAFESASDDLPF